MKTIEPDKETGRSIVVIELESRYAPLPSDARAILRQKTLLGETYVELTPGSADAEPVPEGGSLPESQISDTVQLDEIFRTFDPETRAAFQTWMQEQARGDRRLRARPQRRARQPRRRSPRTPPSWSTSSTARRAPSASLISNTGVVFEALTERDGQLRSLIENSNRVFQATASRDEQLKETFIALPTFERESRADARAAGGVRRRHRPADHPAAAGGARAEPDAAGPRRAVARPRGAVPRARTR